MKYTYAYKTSDGVRHEDSMNASSRDEVFIELRKRGIKAIKVVAADGSKANGEVRGVRKRVVAVLIAIVALGVGVCAYLGGTLTGGSPVSGTAFQTDQSRRQIIGDTAIIEKGIRNGWSDVFELEGERFLASFAIPGVKAGQRNTSEKEFSTALEHKCAVADSDSLEARQIKAMVEGMKQELREFIADGGSVKQYGRRLVQRQEQELGYYSRAKSELDALVKSRATPAQIESMWQTSNTRLRKLGIRLLPMPGRE